MKKIMFLAFAMVAFIGSVMAQGNQGGDRGMSREQRMKMRMDRLNEQLTLTDEQKVKVEALFKEQDDQRMKAREQQPVDRESMRANIEKMRSEQDAKMKSILTEEQYAKYIEMNKNMGQRGGMGRGMGQQAKDQVSDKAQEVNGDATKATEQVKDKKDKAAAKKAKKEAKLKKAVEEVQ